MDLGIKILQTIFLLVKEYFLEGEGQNRTIGKKAIAFGVGAALILCSLVTIYLGEQARQNLTIHSTIIKQYNDLVLENKKSKAAFDEVNRDLISCEARIAHYMERCPAQHSPAIEYVYDPKTKMMVEKPNK